eukprot:TRINITY_DN112732_c0_g1_i1.p1 TRINITY_DN112732_c0_g1~~TRINITY_DN112732_c0_g1_i1.p1  ORF type:complete len:152 (-),score=25.71 TRINITY_DN112732_c0_g1_i1:62-517(-)
MGGACEGVTRCPIDMINASKAFGVTVPDPVPEYRLPPKAAPAAAELPSRLKATNNEPPLAALRANAEAGMADMEANFDTSIFDIPDSASQAWNTQSWRNLDLQHQGSHPLYKASAGAGDAAGRTDLRWGSHFWDTGGETPGAQTPKSDGEC